MYLFILLTVFCITNGALSLTLPPACESVDLACIEALSNVALPQLFTGVPEYGIEDTDPLFLEEIEAELGDLKYKFSNVTLTGGKKSYSSNVVVNKEFTKTKYDLNFPKLDLFGKYEMSGKLLGQNIEGSGDFLVTTGKYIISVDADFEKYKGEDGIIHGKTSAFKLKCHPVDPVVYDFKNLFNGQKELADPAKKFVNEHWAEVAEVTQEPIWMAIMTKVFKNFNKHLEHIPFSDIVKML